MTRPVLKGNWRYSIDDSASFKGELEAVFTLVSLPYLEYGSRQRIEHSGFDADGIGGLFIQARTRAFATLFLIRFRVTRPSRDNVRVFPPALGTS